MNPDHQPSPDPHDDDEADLRATEDILERLSRGQDSPDELAADAGMSRLEFARWVTRPRQLDALRRLAQLDRIHRTMRQEQLRAAAATRLGELAINGPPEDLADSHIGCRAADISRRACNDMLRTRPDERRLFDIPPAPTPDPDPAPAGPDPCAELLAEVQELKRLDRAAANMQWLTNAFLTRTAGSDPTSGTGVPPVQREAVPARHGDGPSPAPESPSPKPSPAGRGLSDSPLPPGDGPGVRAARPAGSALSADDWEHALVREAPPARPAPAHGPSLPARPPPQTGGPSPTQCDELAHLASPRSV